MRNTDSKKSRVGIKDPYFFFIGSTPSPSSRQLHISSNQLNKELNLDPPKLRLYQLAKRISAEIAADISSALRDLSVIIKKSILCCSPKFRDKYPAGTLDSLSGTQNEQKNTHDNTIDRETRTLSM